MGGLLVAMRDRKGDGQTMTPGDFGGARPTQGLTLYHSFNGTAVAYVPRGAFTARVEGEVSGV